MKNFTSQSNTKFLLLFCAIMLAISTANVSAQVSTLTEGFTTVPPPGWVVDGNSTPVGTNPTFVQGNPAVFNAQAGPTNSWALANFNATTGTNTISTFLITPQLNLQNGAVMTFFTRTTPASPFPDRLQVRLSTAGASVNVGTTNADVGDFTTLLLDINPTLVVGGYPEDWTQFTVNITGLAAPTTGRIAFRYFVPNGGPTGDNSNIIGIDTFNYTAGATASGVSVSGKVLARDTDGNRTPFGVSSAIVTLTDMNGQVRRVRTDAAGNYLFEEVNAGETYIVNVYSKRYNFAPQTITITENLSDLNFMSY